MTVGLTPLSLCLGSPGPRSLQVDALLLLAQEEERGMQRQRAVERLQLQVAELRSSLAQVRTAEMMSQW